MKIAIIIVAAASLSACANMPRLDICKSAETRRNVYAAAITAADVFIASGRPVPSSVYLGRDAAVTALAILNRNCPQAPS